MSEDRRELDEADWDQILAWVRGALERRGLSHTFGAGAVHVSRPTGPASFQLSELGELLGKAPREQWRTLVQHWVRLVLLRDDAVDLTDLSQVRPRLRLRLWADGIDGPEARLVDLRVMEDVRAVLALDLPGAVLAVSPEQLAGWGLEPRDAMGIGLHHVVRDPVAEEHLEGPDGAPIHVRTGPGHFVASQALALEQWVDEPNGALVAVPNRHTLLYHPITDGRALAVVQALRLLAAAPFAEGPGSISPHVYWWQPGRFARIEVIEDEETGSVALRPPAGFAELLRALDTPDTHAPETP